MRIKHSKVNWILAILLIVGCYVKNCVTYISANEVSQYKVIYEISKHPFPSDTFITLVLLIGPVLILQRDIKQSNKRLVRVILRTLQFLIVLVLGSLFVASFSYGGSDAAAESKQYYSGDFKVVEGKLENFEISESGKTGSFYVDGVYFDGGYAETGYRRTFDYAKEHEGTSVRISYIEDRGEGWLYLYIMKLEVLTE